VTKQLRAPVYICAKCGISLRAHIICHYVVEFDKKHVCKPILKAPSEKDRLAVEELIRFNESMSPTDKQKILQIDNNKPITGNWRKKR
jgi:hypothetical protein